MIKRYRLQAVPDAPETPGRPYPRESTAAVLAGARPATTWVHVAVLILAAAADLAAFAQVVSLVMFDQPILVIWMMVVGFTATALYLAHCAGQAMRERSEGAPRVARKIAILCLGMWLPLGLAAFWVRLRVNPAVIIAPPEPEDTLASALIFLALYLASGMVAMIGAYLTHNVAASGYLTALRKHQRLTKRAAGRARRYQAARCTVAERRREQERSDLTWQSRREARRALADALKQEVRVILAAHLQDAAATDSLIGRTHGPEPALPDDPADDADRQITGMRTRSEPSGDVRQYEFGPDDLVIVDKSKSRPVLSWSGDRFAADFLEACRPLSADPATAAVVVVDGERLTGPAGQVVPASLRDHEPRRLDDSCDFVRIDGPDYAIAYHRMPHPSGEGPVVISFVGAHQRGPDALELARRTASPAMVKSIRTVTTLEFPSAASSRNAGSLFRSAPRSVESVPQRGMVDVSR